MDASVRLSIMSRVAMGVSAAWLAAVLILRTGLGAFVAPHPLNFSGSPLLVGVDALLWGTGVFFPPLFILIEFRIARAEGLRPGLKRVAIDAVLYICFVAFATFQSWITTGSLL